MSTLGALSGKIEHDQQLLRKLNSSLVALSADALGRTADFGYSEQEISESRKTLLEFVRHLQAALGDEFGDVELQPLVDRLKSGVKPPEDWQADLACLAKWLQSRDALNEEVLSVAESVISLLDSEFTEGVHGLYAP